MKRTTFNNLGGLQSLFFCVGIYTVALFFSIFVCSSVFYAINPKKAAAPQTASQSKTVAEKPVYASVER
jgi:type III secretory pathway component EscR